MKAKSLSDKTVERVRVLRVRDGDIIVIRKWQSFSDDDHDKIIRALKDKLKGSSGVVALFVDSFGDIRTLPEEKMNKLGWYRLRE